MPGTDEETILAIENRLKTLTPISKQIEQGHTPEQILEEVLGEGNVQILEKMPVAFECQCSKERIENALLSLGKSEIRNIIEEDGEAEANCHFCNEKYHFSKEELEQLEGEAR